MTKGLFNLGIELCDEVAAFAPKTRSRRIKIVELTASALEVRGPRLRALLERVYAGNTPSESTGTMDEAVTRILEIVAEWSGRGEKPAALAAQAALIKERGELFLSLHRRQIAGMERASQA